MPEHVEEVDWTTPVGSGNVFADLEMPNPEECLLKARLVIDIRRMAQASGMTEAQLSERVGMGQPDLSRLLKGIVKDTSTQELLRVITALG